MLNIKKIVLFLFLFLYTTTLSFADSGTSSVTRNNTNVECGTSVSHGITHHGVPIIIITNAPTNGTAGCITHTYYPSDNYTKVITTTSGVTTCNGQDRVVSWTATAITCSKYDDIAPVVTDIGNTVPPDDSDLLAVDSKNFQVIIGVAGGSPITSIKAFFENYNTTNSYLASSHEYAPSGYNENIQNVDNMRNPTGERDYSLKVSKVCDEAGNCIGTDSITSSLKLFYYNVYANTLSANITTKSVNTATNTLDDLTNIADGTNKNLTITLKDKYGNQIIPATGIDRTIDFNFNVNNTMYLNQQLKTGTSSIFLTNANSTTDYTNKFTIGTNTGSLNTQSSLNGDYVYNFKVYTPTGNQDDGPVSDTGSEFKINNITFDVDSSLFSPVGANPQNQLVSNSNIITKFSPLYYTAISGEIKDEGIAEGGVQNSTITITKDNASTSSPSPSYLQLSYGGTDASKFNMYGGSAITTIIQINSIAGNMNTSPTFPTTTTSTSLKTKLVQKPGAVGNISRIYLATHIAYSLDGKDIVYNSDIIGKSSYWDGVDNLIANQSSLKVLGQVNSKSTGSLTTSQFPNDIKIIGNSDKFISKTSIVKNGYDFAKNVSGYTINANVLTSIDTPNVGTYASNIIYFGAETGHPDKTYILGNGLGADTSISTKKTILVIGGNLYIKNNLYYTGNGMLGIVVLKDKQGYGGNIYIDPGVTNIVGSLFAEKSILGYNGTSEIDGSVAISILKNQLHIYGNLFSENTIGGSRENPPRCPYFITSGCDIQIAQKYDLNYLRRYYLIPDGTYMKPANSGKAIGGGTYTSNGDTTGGTNYHTYFARYISNTSQPYSGNATLIEYNSKIQTNPPPLFKISN